MKEVIQKDLLFFYLEYGFKFTQWIIRNIKTLWLNFLKMEVDYLRVESYALQNKRLNEKHGEFDPEHRVLNGYSGISRALELDQVTVSRILKIGKDENELFKKEVKARTEPYTHLANKNDHEKLIEEKQKELKGLGEIIAIKEPKPEFGEEELKPTESEISSIVEESQDERE